MVTARDQFLLRATGNFTTMHVTTRIVLKDTAGKLENHRSDHLPSYGNDTGVGTVHLGDA